MTFSITSSTPESGWRKRLKSSRAHLRRNPVVMVGIMIILLWVFCGVFAAQIAPFEPLRQNISNRTLPPNTDYRFGTDELGRDIFTRVIYGARITIPAGIAVVIIGAVIGTLVGAVAGYVGGFWDELLMRTTELFLAFPTIILALSVSAALGPDIKNAIIALVVVWWPSYARLIRGLVLEMKNKEYVEAAQSVGATHLYILSRTILPNCISPALILATLDIGNAILTFAGLSFLGLGPDPSSPEWGRMVAIGIDFFDQWWMWLFPGMAIASLVMAFNFIGDGLRDMLDPRLRRM